MKSLLSSVPRAGAREPACRCPAPMLRLSFLSGKISGRLCALHFPSHGLLRAQVSLTIVFLGAAHLCVLGYRSSLHPRVPLNPASWDTAHPCIFRFIPHARVLLIPHPWVPRIPASLGTTHPHVLKHRQSLVRDPVPTRGRYISARW